MSQRVIVAHPLQVAELLERKRAMDAAVARFVEAATLVSMGHGIVDGELEHINADTNEITIAVADPPALADVDERTIAALRG